MTEDVFCKYGSKSNVLRKFQACSVSNSYQQRINALSDSHYNVLIFKQIQRLADIVLGKPKHEIIKLQ